jgi:hypothetical protein
VRAYCSASVSVCSVCASAGLECLSGSAIGCVVWCVDAGVADSVVSVVG